MQTSVWQSVELVAKATRTFTNPYVEVSAYADFTHEGGTALRRPAFWDGADVWRVRFAPTLPGKWACKWSANHAGIGLDGNELTIDASPARAGEHGFLTMSPGGRSVMHADGTPWLMVADTVWAIPWRAKPDEVEEYARDRQAKGFNAALLMSVQPDMLAKGPRERGAVDGFDVGFEDLPTGHINDLNPAYFQRFDKLVGILVAHGIVPVYQPVFHGYGWRGGNTAGCVIPHDEYARYCRYLVARFGAMPAMWLIGADGHGGEPGVYAGGREVEAWDCYKQPTGMHYSPVQLANVFQGEPWLDFQWCQTGHWGEHLPERVADMWRNMPIKAVANGEPTYEKMADPERASGWWQGHEAWGNLCAGGTMGVVYGAGSLWQWRPTRDEPYQPWCMFGDADWRDAMRFEGSAYVGLIGKILREFPTADMSPNWSTGYSGGRGLFVPGKLLIRYQERGGDISGILRKDVPRNYRVVDPRTGEILSRGAIDHERYVFIHLGNPKAPRVVIFAENA